MLQHDATSQYFGSVHRGYESPYCRPIARFLAGTWWQELTPKERLSEMKRKLISAIPEERSADREVVEQLFNLFLHALGDVFGSSLKGKEASEHLEEIIGMHKRLTIRKMAQLAESECEWILIRAIGEFWAAEMTPESLRAYEYLVSLYDATIGWVIGSKERNKILVNEVVKTKSFGGKNFFSWISRGDMPKGWIEPLAHGWLKSFKVEGELKSIAFLYPVVKALTNSPYEDALKVYLGEDVFPEIEKFGDLHADAVETVKENICGYANPRAAFEWTGERGFSIKITLLGYYSSERLQEYREELISCVLQLRKKHRDFTIDASVNGEPVFS